MRSTAHPGPPINIPHSMEEVIIVDYQKLVFDNISKALLDFAEKIPYLKDSTEPIPVIAWDEKGIHQPMNFSLKIYLK